MTLPMLTILLLILSVAFAVVAAIVTNNAPGVRCPKCNNPHTLDPRVVVDMNEIDCGYRAH